MKTSLNPLMYINSKKFIFLKEDEATDAIKTLKLKAGDYYVSGRSGGGAGSSGAGGIGEFFESNFTLLNSTEALYNVGSGGLVFEEGGNGGNYINLPVQFTLKIVPTPSNATVILTAPGIAPASSVYDFGFVSSTTIEPDGADGGTFHPITTNYDDMEILRYQQDGNTITVEPGTIVTCTVSAPDYVTQTFVTEVTEDTVLPVNLVWRYKTLTIIPDPADAEYATVTFNTGTVSGNSTTVYEGTSVTYTVSRPNYESYTNTIVVTTDQTINAPALEPSQLDAGSVTEAVEESSDAGSVTDLEITSTKDAGGVVEQ